MRHLAFTTLFWLCLLAAVILPMRSMSADNELLVSGYGNAHFMDHDGVPDMVHETPMDVPFMQLREFSLFFDFVVTDGVLASFELSVEDDGNLFHANYAYADIDVTDNIGLRVGKIIVPFLSYNENKPNFKQHLMSQPFTAFNVVPVIGVPIEFHELGWTDAGIAVTWHSAIGDLGVLDLKAAIINGLSSESDVLDDNTIHLDTGGDMGPSVRPRDGLKQNQSGHELRDNNGDKATVVKLSYISSQYPVDVGFSWYRGKWDDESVKELHMLGVHLNLLYPDLTLKSEYVVADVDQEAGIDLVGEPMASMVNTSVGDYRMKAWYVEGTVVPFRYTKDRFLRVILRLDDVDTNDQVAFTPWDRFRLTAGTEWQFAKNTRFRYEWQRSTIDSFDAAPGAYKLAGGNENITMSMLSMVFSF